MKGYPWDANNCKAEDSISWQASTSRSLWSPVCCNRAHDRSQYVPMKSSCKKVFGLQLLNTASFLVSQIDQQIAVAPVNNNILCLCPPCLDQLLNKSSIFTGGGIPKYLTQDELHAIKISHNDIQQRGVG